MRQYIVLGITYLLAFSSFFFFIVQDDGNRPVIDRQFAFYSTITLPDANQQDPEEQGQEQRDEEQSDEIPNENNNVEENGTKETSNNGENNEGNQESERFNILWGVDSASLTDETLYACVAENFGDPQIWGRYLEDKDGVSYGLTSEEVELLHQNGVAILVIYNHFTDGTSYDKGVADAEYAIAYAERIGVPEGVAIFANVEPFYPIDSDFILGWYDTISSSVYTPAIYGVFSEGEEVRVAFEAAAEENSSILDEMIIWSNQPQVGITTEGNAPEYSPEGPNEGLTWAYQYGLDAETCNIDTNLFQSSIMDFVWQPE